MRMTQLKMTAIVMAVLLGGMLSAKTVFAGDSANAPKTVLVKGAKPKDGKKRRPNFVLIFADDQGYGDLGCFGAKGFTTPNIDKMAKEGMKLTDFYSQPVCGPARTALLTGCYPIRVAEFKNEKNKFPYVHSKEILLPKMLQQAGYATGMVGKVDITLRARGWKPELNPVKRGFDFFYGVVGANDRGTCTLLHRNEKVIAKQVRPLNDLLQNYTREALGFIRKNKDQPFLLYFAHTMPHVKLAVSKAFVGKSKRGLYGDVIQEMDWSAGQIVKLIKELKLENDTIIVYTSDNGPWLRHSKLKRGSVIDAGSTGPLRHSKETTWEGGVRVPCVVWGPGYIPAGKVSSEVAATIDLFPTFIELAGAKMPTDRIIDGKSIAPIITGKPNAKSPREAQYYYNWTNLQALRSGPWKLVFKRIGDAQNPLTRMRYRGHAMDSPLGLPPVKELTLYNLVDDIGETTNVAKKHPKVVARLQALAEIAYKDLGDYRAPGKGVRFFEKGEKWPNIKPLREQYKKILKAKAAATKKNP